MGGAVKRNLKALANNPYDLVIVGGGIYGACVAWDAALRGLSVCLVEKSDFGSATSANSLKIIHGGLRYLQYGDLKQMRESIRERQIWMRIAPHLIHPLPVLIPIYNSGWTWGKKWLSLALLVNDLIGFDRNRTEDPEKHIPQGEVISKSECLRILSDISRKDLSGGAIFYDAQVYNTERLLLSFLRSANRAGVDLANYIEVTGSLKKGDRVVGVEVRDVLTEGRFHIRARTVVNACGPWLGQVLGFMKGGPRADKSQYAKAINLVTHPLFQRYAIGILGANGYHDPNTLIPKESPLLFFTPWRGRALIGTTYRAYQGTADEFQVTAKDIQDFLDEINRSYPAAGLKPEDISFVHGGLLPSAGACPRTGAVKLPRKYRILDHREDGVQGVLSVVGVKYTAARLVAEEVVDQVFASWGKKPPRSPSSVTPIQGGEIDRFETYLRAQIEKKPCGLGEEVTRHLVYNYGSAYPEVLRYLDRCADECHPFIDHLALHNAEVLHGIRDEMAQKLTDVIFRRTELGTAGHPGDEVLTACAEIMGAELGWTAARTQQELQEVNEQFAFAR
jgi:glycerol-3-phosphate dehydrogenase